MCIVYLDTRCIVNFPVLDFAALGTDEHIVTVNLEKFSRRRIQIQRLQIVLALRF